MTCAEQLIWLAGFFGLVGVSHFAILQYIGLTRNIFKIQGCKPLPNFVLLFVRLSYRIRCRGLYPDRRKQTQRRSNPSILEFSCGANCFPCCAMPSSASVHYTDQSLCCGMATKQERTRQTCFLCFMLIVAMQLV
jgi:hypothetical protein